MRLSTPALVAAKVLAKHMLIDMDSWRNDLIRRPRNLQRKAYNLSNHSIQYNGGKIEARLVLLVGSLWNTWKVCLANYPLNKKSSAVTMFGPEAKLYFDMLAAVEPADLDPGDTETPL